MINNEGQNVDLYIPRKWYAEAPAPSACTPSPLTRAGLPRSSATNRLIHAKDRASVQINIGHVGAWSSRVGAAAVGPHSSRVGGVPGCADPVTGVYTGECTTLALCGFLRKQGEADAAVDRLWTKQYENAGRQI